MEDRERNTIYEYDDAGNLTRVVGSFLDFAGYCQPDGDRYSGSGNLTLSYEGNRLVSVASDAGDITANYAYDSNNRLISRTTAFNCGRGGINETFTYNKNGKLALYELVDEFEAEQVDRGLNTIMKYEYNDNDQIISIKRSRHRNNGLGRVRELNFVYNSHSELIEIQNVYDDIQGDKYSLTYEDGICQEQAYTDPEYIASPTHTILNVEIYPASLRCGFFLPSLDDT